MGKFEGHDVFTSDRKNKKYMINVDGKIIHFGDLRYEHFKDKLGHYKDLDHNDPIRRKRYLARAKGIRDKDGNLTWNNPMSPTHWSIKILW